MTWLSGFAIRKAHRFILRGDRGKAIGLLDRAMERGSTDPRVGLQRAILLRSDECFSALSDEYRGNGAIALHFTLALLNNPNTDKAEQIAKEALEDNGGNISLQALYAIIQVKKGQGWRHLISSKIRLEMAVIKIQALALMEIEKAIALGDPSDIGAKERETGMGGAIGWIFARLDDMAVWVYWAFRQIINLIRNIGDLKRMKIGRYLIENEKLAGLGNAKAGARRLENIFEIDPYDEEALQSILHYYLEVDDFENMDKYLARLKMVNPNDFEENPFLQIAQAETLFAQKRYSEALGKYSGAQEDFPFSYIIPYKKGLSHLRMGEETKAVALFEVALNIPNEGLIKERLDKLGRLAAKDL
ncbi:hypothetical protein MNBD_NITROSPINAE02-2203 [hydrothermal vent metagenome]|uniref:Uncharacterized protein n=1 Tax=hydrothermal vent metagenome TaxID=652676 RepID=A0A3B1CBY4_9ZZZZ